MPSAEMSPVERFPSIPVVMAANGGLAARETANPETAACVRA
eukprot:CAMPEP_0206139474 /NCGR_PEP_ID=MMETSP1473-20131121/6240_1 /ASSEMBLY_ACC=CAM_ASM_001109 /TAXON_ID=1461547 /ORGANISM="Stichococcus sp, Strain RCC1054" /LENGTH=41 /DNA_ID= /DNA_START= /DNA_END= /DNA_ORIENTATION=